MDTTLSAQRRNLMLTSIGFVLYAVGEGKVKDELSLPIGIELSNPEVLLWAAWICLFWFYWRYWIYADAYIQGEVITKYHSYLQRHYTEALRNRATQHASYEGNRAVTQWRMSNFTGGLWSWEALLSGVDAQNRMVQDSSLTVQEQWYQGFWFKLRSFVNFSFEQPTFSDYIVPHILFLTALCAGGYASA